MRQSFLVPPLGIEPGPSEPESEILSFKLQGHPSKGTAKLTIFADLQAIFPVFSNVAKAENGTHHRPAFFTIFAL